MIGVKQEEFIHQNGNENDLVEFEGCLPWQDLTNGINCSKICMPVIFHALFGQLDDKPKCHVPSEHHCMIMTSAEKLVRISLFRIHIQAKVIIDYLTLCS